MIILSVSSNLSFEGNWFQNSSNLALNFTSGDHLQFYHNNFVNYGSPAKINGADNISFNSTYPVGGNYWSSNTAVDKYSGPAQNIAGADGISDTAFSVT